MSAPFDDEETLSTGELPGHELVFAGWDESDRCYLELDFASPDGIGGDDEDSRDSTVTYNRGFESSCGYHRDQACPSST
jgi:hypothetical protein